MTKVYKCSNLLKDSYIIYAPFSYILFDPIFKMIFFMLSDETYCKKSGKFFKDLCVSLLNTISNDKSSSSLLTACWKKLLSALSVSLL